MKNNLSKYAESNQSILESIKNTTNVVTKNSLEMILLGRSNRGDEGAGLILYRYLKGWEQ